MSVALYVIGSTFAVLLLSVRLREARAELARVRDGCEDRKQEIRDEYSAYARGVTVTLACLLAGLGAAQWQSGPVPKPEGDGQDDRAAGTHSQDGRAAR